MAISASASFEFTVDISDSTTMGPINNLVDWSQLLIMMDDDYKEFVNDLHLEENRKDIFKVASINPNSIEHSHRVMNQHIPAKRNYRGKQSQRI